eukprot:XP_001198673.1 PREDICTED: calcium-binding protein SPEC 2D [Strongylocentrotus purpuratus]
MAAKIIFTEQQIAEFKKKFEALDKKSDGTFPTRHLKYAMESVGHVLTEDELDKSRADDGTMTFPEFLEIIAGKVRSNWRTAMPQYRTAFKALDKDGDNLLCADELRQAMLSIDRPMSEEEINAMIDKADFTNDGKVDLKEFIKMMMNFC